MSKFKHLFFIVLFSIYSLNAISQLVSVPFKDGFIGVIGTNTQKADDVTTFTTLGITKSAFIQQTLDGDFYKNQGNDIGGKLRLYFSSSRNVTISSITTSKNYIDIEGIIVWRGQGGGNDFFGFIPNPNTNISFSYSTNSTFNINRSADGNSGSNIGNLRVDRTTSFTDLSDYSGNAAGVIDDLNTYKNITQNLDPSGPVTVNSQTTSNQTPTITGTATLNTGESLTVTVNGLVYSVGDGNLSISGTTWTLVIPNSNLLPYANYSVEAIITNTDGYTKTDGSSNELIIQQPPTLTVNGTLKTFTTCSGCTIDPQSFTVSGSNLTQNIVVTAPTGVQVSTFSNTSFGSTVTLTPNSGTVTTTTVYAKLANNATTGSSGTISVTTSGASSQTLTVTTNTDNALNFDGVDDYVSINSPIINGQSNFTIEAWVKPDSRMMGSGYYAILGAQQGATNTDRSPSLFIGNGGKIHFDSYNSGTTERFAFETTESLIRQDKWNHIAIVKNGLTYTLYVNGVSNFTRSAPSQVTALANYNIGETNSSFYSGSIDEVRFWSTARSSAEINADMTREYIKNETGLLAYLNFNQGEISAANTGISYLNTLGSINPTAELKNLSLNTGSTSNFVPGFIPEITGTKITTANGNVTLTNSLSGGVWSSTNTAVATVDANTGVVTGVSTGTASIIYTICEKTVATNFTVAAPPTVTIEGKNSANVSRASGSKTNDATLILTFTTSESTTNFVVGDVTVSGGTLSGFSGSGTIYTATLTPSGTGTITVDINSGKFSNTDGLNNSAATQYVWLYDNTAPTITITGKNSANVVRASGSTTNDATLTLTFTTSENTGNFTATDVTVSGGTLSNFSGSGSTYTATLTPAAPGIITINVNGVVFTDEVGNNNISATAYTWEYTTADPNCSTFNITDFSLNGNATSSGNIITLTPDSFSQNGSAWNTKRIFLTENFDIKAKINLGSNDNGADGIAFVLQDKALNAGSSGGGLGYQGIAPSYAVEFDTYDNGSADPTGSDHIAIVKNGLAASAAAQNEYAQAIAVSNLENNVWRDVRFVWNAASKNFKVYYINVADNSTPIFNVTVDLKATIFNNLDYAYWGFTSATGGAKNLQRVEITNYCYVPQVSVNTQPTTSNQTKLTSFCTDKDLILESDAGLSYQWYKNGEIIVGATSRTLTVTQSGIYKVEHTSNIGYTTTSQGVTINVLPLVLTQPTSPSVSCPGTGTKTFSVSALGNGLTYQWQVSSDGGNNWTSINNGGIYSGATTATLTLTNPTLAIDGYKYRAVLNGTCGVAATTDGLASISFTEPPTIVTQPTSPDVICDANGTATFTVSANNASSYQWQVSTNNGLSWSTIANSSIYSGTTSSTLSIINPPTTFNNYRYRVVASGTCSPSATSDGTAKITFIALTYANNSFSLTKNVAITAINPTSSSTQFVSYSVSPALPTGLSINSTSGIITGTPSVVSAAGTRVITATTASGCIATFNISFTVIEGVNILPQATVNAVDYALLESDTVNLKLAITNGTAPFTLILNNSVNSTKDTITDLTPVNNEVTFKLKRLDTTKVFTIFKLIDANNNTRTSGFTKDTTRVNVLKPKILLTLKAEPTVKQADNSFKTRLLLKVKNSGDIDLRNVQVNANLSSVFPSGINYVLDSIRVLAGNFALNPNYTGAGSATSASSTQFTATASSKGSKQSFATLDQNYLFNNGVSLNKDEEGEVVYYVSIGATTQNVTLKLQFESAGDGVLVKNDGTSSAQGTTSASDDGTNIDQHPDLTNNGVPAPTYVPLFPNEKVGASLSVSSSTPVTGGYEFHFVAKIKNYGNVNLDSIRIEYDLDKMYPSPDQAVLVSNPTITRGNIVYNAATFDGVNDINLFDYGGKLEVGDSATYEYDLKVTTNRTTYTWPNYFVVYARSINSGLIVNDTSMAGSNPDPNNDNDPLERFFTNVTISYEVPAPPVVENKTYVYGTTIPSNIGGLVKSTPTGTIPVWCDEKTAACSVTPPSTPTEIGRYIFALRSYDTATLLYSDVLVYDTIIIKPPVPLVVNKKYIIGNTANPNNVSGQVTGLVNSTLKYFRNATLQTSIPTLGNTAGVIRYTTSQTVNSIESDTVGFTVTLLDPTTLLHLQKIASEPRLLPNSSFNITYTFLVRNRSEESMTNILVADNLQNTFPSPTLFEVTSVSSTGGLVFNNAFNGKTDIQLLRSNSVLAANTTDTIRLTLNLQPKGYTGTVNNVAVITATTPYGSFSMNSSSTGFANETVKTPTPLTIPDLKIDIPEAFSPNRDGVNDRFVIVKPFGTTLELEVYNRWGNVVYYNANYNNEWDGRGTNNFIGQDLMDGGYYYTLKTKSANGNSQIFKGFVLIQR